MEVACFDDRFASEKLRFGPLGKRKSRKILQQVNELSKKQYVTPYVDRIYAALGEGDQVFRCLDIGYRESEALTVCLKTDPRLDDLHSDPRFQDLMRRMNFP